VAMEGQHISDAQLGFNSDNGQPVVNFKLDSSGASQFGEMTRANIGRPLAVVLDGKVITAPVIRSAIAGGSGEISGGFTSAEASNLALLLRGGALPVPLKVLEERTVGPDLGSDAIAMGLSTGLLGAALVFAFMLGLYGRWGAIACERRPGVRCAERAWCHADPAGHRRYYSHHWYGGRCQHSD